MSKSVILITGVGGDIGQSVIKCLKDENIKRNIEILGCDVDYYAAGKIEVAKFFQSPWANEPQKYLSFMEKLKRTEGINYIFPTTEAEIEFFNENRNYFIEKKIAIFINNNDIISTFSDKFTTVNFLKKNKLPFPLTFELDNYSINKLPFPLLLKPRKGCGSKGLMIINNEEELNFFKIKARDMIVQEMIGSPDEEYTVGVFSTGKNVYSIAFKRVLHLGYGGLSKIAQLVLDDRIKELAEKIAKVSSLKGPLNIQLRKTEKGYIPFEINPRLSSTVYLRHCFGFQDVKWWINLIEGKEIIFKLKYKKGVGVRRLDEVFFGLE